MFWSRFYPRELLFSGRMVLYYVWNCEFSGGESNSSDAVFANHFLLASRRALLWVSSSPWLGCPERAVRTIDMS